MKNILEIENYLHNKYLEHYAKEKRSCSVAFKKMHKAKRKALEEALNFVRSEK